MTLGINTQIADGGNFLPQIRYNVDAGRLFQVDRTQDAQGAFHTQTIELGEGFTAVFDYGAIEVGWMLLAAGMAPSWSMLPLHAGQAERPSEQHKHGFRMHIWNPKIGLREFASASKTLVDAVDEVHTTFERAPEAARGLIPVVKYKGASYIPPRGAASKPRFRPQFEIVGWRERGAEFGDRTVPPPRPRMAAAAGVMPLQQAPQAAANFPPQQAQQRAADVQSQLGKLAVNPRHVPPPAAKEVDEWGMPVGAAVLATVEGDLDDEIPF